MSASEIRGDDWLSGLFSRPVFQIAVRAGDVPSEVAGEVSRHSKGLPDAFYYTRIDATDVPMVSALTSMGMAVVDVNVTFAIRSAAVRIAAPPVTAMRVREALPEDADATLAIAEREYQVSRFHRDPLVPVGLANRIKREWVANYFAGRRGERLWVAVVDEEVAGFLAVVDGTTDGERVKTIDLVAVKSSKRGRGVGSALVAFFLRHYASKCDRLQVGTQIANLTSIRMYERAGMRLDRAQYVLHLHRP